jgi:hypothetical protein
MKVARVSRSMRIAIFNAALVAAATLLATPAQAQRCDIPREARDIWRCENGFVVGPENVIIRLPIPETDPETLFNAGLEAAQREDWRVAIAYFTAAHQRAHLAPKYIYNLGLAHARAGHDLPAMAWLVAYLTAEPNAPNRAAVWAEIAQIETRVRANVDALWALGVQAADSLPNVGSRHERYRWRAYGSLAYSALMLADRDRAIGLLNARAPMCGNDNLCPPNVETDLSWRWLHASKFVALVQDFDPEAAEAIDVQMSPGSQAEYAFLLNRTRGERLVTLDRYYFEPGYTDFGLRLNVVVSWDALEMARAGELDTLFQLARDSPTELPSRNMMLQAARHEVGPLLARFAQTPSTDTSEPWEALISDAGEIWLLLGDRPNAERAFAESQRFASEDTGYRTRLQALLAADAGRADEALIAMEIASTRLTGAVASSVGFASEAAPMWFRIRHAPAAMLAEFLFARGRAAEAFAIVTGTDSLRRVRFYESAQHRPNVESQTLAQIRTLLSPALNEAARGCAGCIARRIAIENAVTDAANLRGSQYDPAGNLRAIAARQDAEIQVVQINSALHDHATALRRIRGLYRRSGGTWGQ